MKIRTEIFNIGTILTIFLLFTVFVPVSNAIASDRFGLSSVQQESLGLIGATAIYNESLYIGSENGLFEVTGNYVEQLDKDVDVLSGGFISALSIHENTIWIAVYGKGIVSFDMDTSEFEQITLDENLDEYFWSVEVLGDKLLASFVSGVAVFSLEDNSLLATYYANQFSGIESDEFVQVFKDEKSFYTFSNSGILKVKTNSSKIEFLKREQFFPKLENIQSIRLDFKHLLVAGNNGVYILDANTLDETRFVSFEEQPSWPVSSLLLDNRNKLWVAAGGLFKEKSGRLTRADFLQPFLDASRIAEVTSLFQMDDGQILMTSTQQGLIVLPETYQALRYLSLNSIELPNNVFSAVQLDDSKLVIATDSGYFTLDTLSGALTTLSTESLADSRLFRFKDSVVDILSCKSVMRISREKTLSTAQVFKSCQDQHISGQSDYYQGLLFLNENGGRIDIFDHYGSKSRSVPVPKSIYMFDITREQEIVALNEQNELLIEEDGVWTRKILSLPSSLEFTCLKSDSNYIYLCSSGNGLIRLDKTNDLKKEVISTPSESRYIRDLFLAQNRAWIATNRGLSVVDVSDGAGYIVGTRQGVFDKDFNYGGITRLKDDKLLMSGDSLSYIFDASTFMEELTKAKDANRSVKVVRVNIDGQITRNPFYKNNTITVEPNAKNVGLLISPVSWKDTHGLEIEYRLENTSWNKLIGAQPYLSIRELPYGENVISFRVSNLLTKKSYEVSEFKLILTPPFYLTTEAKIAYCLLLIGFIYLSYRAYLHYQQQRALESEKQLKDKMVALQNSSEMMDQMLKNKQAAMARISHEIRTPLMLVTEPLKNVANKVTDKALLSDIEIITRNANRVSTLVDQLLEIERLSNIGNIPLHRYDIEESCRFLIESIRPMVEQKNQTLKLRLKASGNIHLIQDTLQQIFYNLLSNAVKYSPADTEITVSSKLEGDFLHLSVQDQGPGLSEQEIKSIFNRFSRLENSHKQDGLGLGLSLIKQLVKANQGNIEVSNNKSGGARFDIRLPLLREDSQKATAETPSLQVNTTLDLQATLQQKEHSSLPVMVIADDSQDFREHLTRLFENDYLCFAVRDGKEALKAITVLEPDILLTDNAMPGMSGIELVKQVRQQSKFASMTIFMLSALREASMVKEAHSSMLDDYIFKPFDQDLLKQKVDNRMAAKRDLQSTVKEATSGALFLGKKPNLEGEKDHLFYINLKASLENNIADPEFSREKCAELMFVSERQLNRKLKLILSQSFSETLKQYRVEMAKNKLSQGQSVTDTAYDCGFSNPSYFSTTFKSETGMSPTEFVRQLAK